MKAFIQINLIDNSIQAIFYMKTIYAKQFALRIIIIKLQLMRFLYKTRTKVLSFIACNVMRLAKNVLDKKMINA